MTQSIQIAEVETVLCLDLLDPTCGVAGIDQQRVHAGGAAVECVRNRLLDQRAVTGGESVAMLVPGRWVEGNTLRARPRTARTDS